MPNKKLLLILLNVFIRTTLSFAESYFFDEGTFLPSSFIGTSFTIKNYEYKSVPYSSLSISNESGFPGYGLLFEDGCACFILSKKIIGNKLSFEYIMPDSECSTLKETLDYIENNKNNIEKICSIEFKIIDNDEIIRYIYNNIESTRYYRISGPARIPPQNAVLNDSRVRLRVKPNLHCDTWALLEKGTKCIVKDKSKEPLEIDSESWYWYRVDVEGYPDGWVYGKYLDIEK